MKQEASNFETDIESLMLQGNSPESEPPMLTSISRLIINDYPF